MVICFVGVSCLLKILLVVLSCCQKANHIRRFILCGVTAINITEKKKAQIFCYREKLFTDNFNWMVPMLTSFFAIVEIAIAIASSAVGCCCSAISQAKVRVFVAGGFPNSPEREKSTTSVDYFKATRKTDPTNYSTTKRLEWPDAGLFKNNKRPNLTNV